MEAGSLLASPRKRCVHWHEPRVGGGRLSLHGSPTLSDDFFRQLEEETGITIKESELFDMTAAAFSAGTRGWYPSVGACDEFLRLLYYETAYSREQLEALRGKATGARTGRPRHF